MRLQPKTVLASSLVFPSFQMQETGIEGFGVDNSQSGADTPFDLADMFGGFGVQNRFVLADHEGPLLGSTTRVRFRLEDGALFFEDVIGGPGPVYWVARKSFGTTFDFGVGPFQTEIQLLGRDTGSAHVRVFVPVTFNPLGFANTDQDNDGALKYVFRAGAGAGVDATFLAGSSLLIGARAQGDYRWTYRAGGESLTHNRGDTEWLVDAGIGVRTSDQTAVMAMFMYQNWMQWEYDGPTDGVTRGNQVIGGRLVLRAYSAFKEQASPPPPPPPESTP